MNLFERRSKEQPKIVTVWRSQPLYLIVDDEGIPYAEEYDINRYTITTYTSKQDAENNCPEGYKVVLEYRKNVIGCGNLDNFIDKMRIR